MAIIFIENLQLETIIGVYPHEKTTPQPISLDLEMVWDTTQAAQTDKLADTLDYEAVANHLNTLLSNQTFELIETLAQAIVDSLKEKFALPSLNLTIRKPNALKQADSVGIVLRAC